MDVATHRNQHSAVARVFALPEMLEKILIRVGAGEDPSAIKELFKLQRVNMVFKEALARSKRLRLMMFLETFSVDNSASKPGTMCGYGYTLEEITKPCDAEDYCGSSKSDIHEWIDAGMVINPFAYGFKSAFLRSDWARCGDAKGRCQLFYQIKDESYAEFRAHTARMQHAGMKLCVDSPGSWRKMRVFAGPFRTELCVRNGSSTVPPISIRRFEDDATLGDLADRLTKVAKKI